MCVVPQAFSFVCCGGETQSKFSRLEDHTQSLVSASGRPAGIEVPLPTRPIMQHYQGFQSALQQQHQINSITSSYDTPTMHNARTLYNRRLSASLSHTYGGVCPSTQDLKAIVRFIGRDKVLSVGCGGGFLEGLLKKKGVDVLATDITISNIHYTDIVALDMQGAIEAHPRRKVLLLSCLCCDHYPDLSLFKGSKIISIDDRGQTLGGQPDDAVWDNVSGESPLIIPSVLDIKGTPLSLNLYKRKPSLKAPDNTKA
ncbi:MAG: hypothetical protein ACPG7U_01535 [Holosporaceae bacterium]